MKSETTPTADANATGKPSSVLVVLLVVPLLGILAALLMIATNPSQSSPLPNDLNPQSATLINFTAPPFDVLDPQGDVFSLLDYRGRVVFLNFWQTTCIPCEAEMPELAAFSRDQGETGIAVIAVNFGETSNTVLPWLAARNLDDLKIGLDYESGIQRAYGVQNIPTTFVIDPQGVVVYMKLGAMDQAEMEDYAARFGGA